jgi:hypothetical protein
MSKLDPSDRPALGSPWSRGRLRERTVSFVKRTLAHIPRPVVRLVPLSIRDRVRTALLKGERALRRRKHRKFGEAGDQLKDQAFRRANDALTRLSNKIDGLVESQWKISAFLEQSQDLIEQRLDEINKRLDHLEARITIATSGDAPSPVDDLRDLVEPIEQLRQRLEDLSGDLSDRTA